MSKRIKAVMLLSSAALMVGLSACDSSPQPAAPEQAKTEAPAPSPAFNKFTGNVEQRPSVIRGYSSDEVTMPDGLVVRCLRYYDGGNSTSNIDCNWNAAHR